MLVLVIGIAMILAVPQKPSGFSCRKVDRTETPMVLIVTETVLLVNGALKFDRTMGAIKVRCELL